MSRFQLSLSVITRPSCNTAQRLLLLSILVLTTPALPVDAAMYSLNLDPPTGDEFINGARFLQMIPDNATGTGTFDPFLAVGGSDTERGYNHDLTVGDGAPLMDEDPSKTENIQMSSMPVVTVDGVKYIELLLDAGEPGSANGKPLNLVELQVFTTTLPDQIVPDPVGGLLDLVSATLRYDLDADEDNTVLLDGSLSPGNGKRDLAVLVPLDSFAGAGPSDYLVLFTQFTDADGTFEEWGTDPNADEFYVPEPSAITLVSCVVGLWGFVRRETH